MRYHDEIHRPDNYGIIAASRFYCQHGNAFLAIKGAPLFTGGRDDRPSVAGERTPGNRSATMVATQLR
jgi:hypothetical protein